MSEFMKDCLLFFASIQVSFYKFLLKLIPKFVKAELLLKTRRKLVRNYWLTIASG